MIELIWTDGLLEIQNASPAVHQFLSFQKKNIEMVPFTRKNGTTGERKEVVKRKTPLWRPHESNTDSGDTPSHIVTYQGLVHSLMEMFDKRKMSYRLHDRRSSFPQPDWSKMHGFRGGQAALQLEFLRKDMSGICSAPTRWGKTTHIINTLRGYKGLQTIIVIPGVDLIKQQVDDIKTALPDREVIGIYGSSKHKFCSEDITVLSMDSIDKADFRNTRLVLVDEPHALASPSRFYAFSKFTNARILGFGATTEGRFDNADKLITGLIGPVLAYRSFPEAVKLGNVSPVRVYRINVPFNPFHAYNRDAAYKKILWKNEWLVGYVRDLSRNIIPANKQTLFFIDQTKQAELLNMFMNEAEVAVACKMTPKQRKDKFERMVSGELTRCVSTSIFATGVTFPDLAVVVNLSAGGGSISGTQKPGRVAAIRPGKTRGYVIDFNFRCTAKPSGPRGSEWVAVQRDCEARFSNYERIGYEIVDISWKEPERMTFE